MNTNFLFVKSLFINGLGIKVDISIQAEKRKNMHR